MRDVNGILLLDKPTGYSSNQVLQRVKWLFQAKKAGHGGTLDPLATGMLVIGFGKATRLLPAYLEGGKTYEVVAKLGIKTTTGDSEGDVLTATEPPRFTRQQLEETLVQFQGEITQTPPMYSALKHKGIPLYAFARKGIAIKRHPRKVFISDIYLVKYDHPLLWLSVQCSGGTYIRVLVEDIGEHLGTLGHVTALRRTHVGCFGPEKMVSLDTLEALAKKDLMRSIRCCGVMQ